MTYPVTAAPRPTAGPVAESPTAQRIVVFSASVGAGHDGAAAELTRRLRARGFVVDRHDLFDLVPGRLGTLVHRAYVTQVNVAPRTWDVLLAATGRRRVVARMASMLARSAGDHLLEAIGTGAAAVVSTYPLASQVLGKLRIQRRLDAPVCTFLTDMSVHPLWVSRGVDSHLALHQVAAAQALSLGALGIQVTAPAVRPLFRPPVDEAEKIQARARYGLPQGVPTALLSAGSDGIGPVARAAGEIADTRLVRPVVVCGRNDRLRLRLAADARIVALGWIDDMASLMRACDVMVQNAGGLTSLEALASGLPVITYRSLAGHGRTNAAALDQTSWIPWVRDPADLPDALRRALLRRSTVVGATTRDPALVGAATRDPAEAISALAAAHAKLSPTVRQRVNIT